MSRRHGGMAVAGQADTGARPARLAPVLARVAGLVGVAGGVVDAAAGCSPGHLAGSGLVEMPAGGLVTSMVMPA
jgi:hypothetical protein